MNNYKYKAINKQGRSTRGSISASNELELEFLLGQSEMYLVSYKIEKRSNFLSGKLNTKELIMMFSHLEQLNKAGVTIIESVLDVKNSSESNKIRNLMQEVYEAIKNGSMLSEALAKHPEVFLPVYIGLISTGEKTGNLNDSFTSIVENLKWSLAIKRKTAKAIRYPLFSLLVMFCVVGIMTTVVVPKVTDFLKSQSISLPFATTSLMAFSEFAQNNGLLILISPVIFIIFYKILSKSSLSTKIDEIKLHIPVFGKIINKIEASKFCQFFSITFKSGLGILECLETSKEVITNKAIKLSIQIAKQRVNDGETLAKAIEATGYFPSLVVRMFIIGESTGNMEDSLKNVRFFYDQEINDSIDKIVGMIQPTLTLVMGGMMAWIAIAVFGPIYGSFAKF